MRKFQRNEQPSRLRTSGAGILNMGDDSDPGRDEEIRRAVGMIRTGLDILLRRFDDGEPIPVADLLASRAERFGDRLTDAELYVLTRFAAGESVDEIAQSRVVSKRTINNQISTAVRKLGFADRRELTGYLKGAREAARRRP